jgi:hypothetical protein
LAHASSIAQYRDLYHKSIADPKVAFGSHVFYSAICSRFRQAFWSELALREFTFKFEGDAQTFKHVLRYNFNM